MALLENALRAIVRREPRAAAGDARGGRSSADALTEALIAGYDGGGHIPLILNGHILTRDLASTYATLFRCVTLISGVIADLITQSLRVADRDGKTVNDARTARALRLLRETPDGGATDAYQFLEDVVSDYLLDGNALIRCERLGGDGGEITSLRQLEQSGARMHYTREGVVYEINNIGRTRDYEMVGAMQLAHVRWPLLHSFTNYNQRQGFSRGPVALLSNAIHLGINTDKYVSSYFGTRTNEGGIKSKLSIAYKEVANKEQVAEFEKSLKKYMQSRMPLMTYGGATVTSIDDSPQKSDVLKLREFQVREIGRAYGVPAPLLGENVTQWGSGIEQLARLLYRFGGKHHLQRILAPLTLRLLPEGRRFVVDESQLLKGDTEALTGLITAGLGGGGGKAFMSEEEARELLGLPPELPDGVAAAAGAGDNERSLDDQDQAMHYKNVLRLIPSRAKRSA